MSIIPESTDQRQPTIVRAFDLSSTLQPKSRERATANTKPGSKKGLAHSNGCMLPVSTPRLLRCFGPGRAIAAPAGGRAELHTAPSAGAVDSGQGVAAVSGGGPAQSAGQKGQSHCRWPTVNNKAPRRSELN